MGRTPFGRVDKGITHVMRGWASCPITQNGFVRIISQPRYPSPVSPAAALELLRSACTSGPHEFWLCDIRLLNAGIIDQSRVHGPRQVTDAYLLALAIAHDGRSSPSTARCRFPPSGVPATIS